MLPVALKYPPGIEMVSVCTVPARGGRSCEHFGGYNGDYINVLVAQFQAFHQSEASKYVGYRT